MQIPHSSKFNVVGITKYGLFHIKSEQFDFPYCAKSLCMCMTAVFILLVSDDCFADMEMNSFSWRHYLVNHVISCNNDVVYVTLNASCG